MASKPFDPTLKDLVECGPEDWPALAGWPCARTRIIDADIATVSGAADKALRIETAPPYLLHLEFLAGHYNAAQPRLLHKRNLLLKDRHDLDVRTLAVVLRPEADSPSLTGLRQWTYPGESEPYATFRYTVLRVWQVPPDRFLAGGPGLLPLAPISAVTEAALPGIMEKMAKRLKRGRARTIAAKLWAATYILMGLRYPDGLIEELMRGITTMEESVTYQKILRKGEAKGEAKGSLAEARRMLLLFGENSRLGPAAAPIVAALERIQDVAQLEALAVRVPRVSRWEDLLDQPASRPRRARRSQT